MVSSDFSEVHITKKNGQTEILPCGLTVWAAGQIGQDLVRNMHKQLPKQQELAEVEAKGSDAWMNLDEAWGEWGYDDKEGNIG